MPPTGTSQSPVPPPITWYRKQRFWRRLSSSADANVPMSAVGQRDAAREVGVERRAQQLAERALDDVVPQCVVAETLARTVARRRQRLGDRGEEVRARAGAMRS